MPRRSPVALALACLAGIASCTSSSGLSGAGVTAKAPKVCMSQTFPLRQATRVSTSQASSVVAGHLPGRLPRGFGLQEVDRVEPGHFGYVAWTDARCRRVAITYSPGESSIAAPAVHAFGPWMKLQSCGDPRPCLVWQGGVHDGLLTLSTWQVEPRTATAVLRTVKTGGSR